VLGGGLVASLTVVRLLLLTYRAAGGAGLRRRKG
jgi:hypothetical protein